MVSAQNLSFSISLWWYLTWLNRFCALYSANDTSLYIFCSIFQKEICTPVSGVTKKGLKREKREHSKADTCWYQRAVLLERFDCFINKLHGLISLSFFFWRLKKWIKGLNKQLFHIQLHSMHKSRNMLVLFLCCVAKYTMNLNLKLLCNAERKEVN